MKLPEHVLQKVAIWRFIGGGTEIGGIGAIRKIDEKTFELADLWLEATAISGGGHDIDVQDVAVAFSKHVNAVEGVVVPNLIWHTHLGQCAFFSGTDDQNTKTWIANGKKLWSIVFCSLAKCLARLDWMEDGKHVRENFLMKWRLPELHDDYARIGEMKAENARLWKARANLSAKKSKARDYHRGGTSRLLGDGGSGTGRNHTDLFAAYPGWGQYWQYIASLSDTRGISFVEAGFQFFDELSEREFEDFFGVTRDNVLG